MATEPENQSLTRRHRQVLKVLARAPPRGRDVDALLTLGLKLETMADLVRSGLATVRVETVEERGVEDRGCLPPDHGRGSAGDRTLKQRERTFVDLIAE